MFKKILPFIAATIGLVATVLIIGFKEQPTHVITPTQSISESPTLTWTPLPESGDDDEDDEEEEEDNDR
jgi:hypothetical protein